MSEGKFSIHKGQIPVICTGENKFWKMRYVITNEWGKDTKFEVLGLYLQFCKITGQIWSKNYQININEKYIKVTPTINIYSTDTHRVDGERRKTTKKPTKSLKFNEN